jgi:hypothetical protein
LEQDAFEITAFKILIYLSKHHDAADPINHVVKYWIQRRGEEYFTSAVSEVLEHLVAKGVVQKVGRRAIYKLNPERAQEIEALIALLEPASS